MVLRAFGVAAIEGAKLWTVIVDRNIFNSRLHTADTLNRRHQRSPGFGCGVGSIRSLCFWATATHLRFELRLVYDGWARRAELSPTKPDESSQTRGFCLPVFSDPVVFSRFD